MHDAVLVRALQRLAHRRHDAQRLLRREPSRPQQLAQIHAVHELHEQKDKIRPPARNRTPPRCSDDSAPRAPGPRGQIAPQTPDRPRAPARAASARRAGSAISAAPCRPRPCRRGRDIRGFRAAENAARVPPARSGPATDSGPAACVGCTICAMRQRGHSPPGASGSGEPHCGQMFGFGEASLITEY